MITPDDPHHAALEAEIIFVAEGYGWLVGAATYHAVMPDPVKLALSRCYDHSALYVRGRADRVAVKGPRCILFEAKTNIGKWQRASIEALPLVHYLRVGVPCLYIYRDMKDSYEAAFWTTDMPTIDVVMIPRVWSSAMVMFFTAQFRSVWPDVEITLIPPTNGSGDPFVCITREALTAKGVEWRAIFAGPAAKE